MRSNFPEKPTLTVIDSMVNDSRFEVLEYDKLRGGDNLSTAISLKYMNDSGVKLRQLRILLNESSVQLESGLLSFLKGNINIAAKSSGIFSLGKKFIQSKLTDESFIKPKYEGSGIIMLEPTFSHLILLELDDEEIIIDPGMFYCSESSVSVSMDTVSVATTLLSDEKFFQTKLSGSGIVVLSSPVPQEEIMKLRLHDEELKVDGNFAFLRSNTLNLKIQKSTKTLIGSSVSGEGFLHVYEGTGEVWLMPTKSTYNSLEESTFNLSPKGSYGRNSNHDGEHMDEERPKR